MTSVSKRLLMSAIAIALMASSLSAWTAEVDLHRSWDDRCAECHGHAGEFARKHLRVRDGILEGYHEQRDLRQFMHNHYAAGADVEAIYDMLLAQASTEARFKSECGGCHAKASDLVRTNVVRSDGMLSGRSSGKPLTMFLQGHGGLREDDVPFFVQLLDRIEAEVNPQ